MSTCSLSSGYDPTQSYVVYGNCNIPGSLGLMDSGSITVYNGTLTINGDLVLMNNATLKVINGGIVFPQMTYSEYSVNMENFAVLYMKNSTFVTSNSTVDNFSMSLVAYDNAKTIFEDCSLDTNTGSWLLGNYFQDSVLEMISSVNLPTEVYPNDAAIVSMTNFSNFAGFWMNFNAGCEGNVVIPEYESFGKVFNFDFGPSVGFNYTVHISNSYCRIGLNSYPGSSMTVTSAGNESTQVPIVFGYYFQDNTSPVVVSNLTVGNNMTLTFTDSGRLLSIREMYLNPFSWQVYASNTNGYLVTITDSIINEIATFSDANMAINNSVLQLAVFEAGGTDAVMSIYNSQIWSQAIQAVSGGVLNIVNCDVHGNYINADGSGSVINFISSEDLHNGNSSIANCNPDSYGYTPNIDGVPLCNPYLPLHECAQISATDSGVLNGSPPCIAYPTVAPTANPTFERPDTHQPTLSPSIAPITTVTNNPTLVPTVVPTTVVPSTQTQFPTSRPSTAVIINSNPSSGGGSSPINDAAIVGIVIGSVAALIFIAFIVKKLFFSAASRGATSETTGRGEVDLNPVIAGTDKA